MSAPSPVRLALMLGLLPALGCMSTVGSYVRNVYTDGHGRITGVEKCELAQSSQTNDVWTQNCRVVQPEDESEMNQQWGAAQPSTDATSADETWPASSEVWSDEQRAPAQAAHPAAPIE
jgi:hypothetical protein